MEGKVYEAIISVMEDVGAIEKEKRNICLLYTSRCV